MFNKYKNINIDIVITTDDNALNFIRSNKKDLFTDAKVFFSGVNNINLPNSLDKNIYSGVFERMSPKENVNIAKYLLNDIKTIYLIGDESRTYKILAKIFQNELSQTDIKYKYISNKYIDTIKQQLKNSDKNSVGIFIMPASFRDKNNNFIPMKTAMRDIAKSFNKPIIAPADVFMNSLDVIGGYAVNASSQARALSKLIISYINNHISMSDIGFIAKSPNRYMFDKKYLNKFNIDS